MPESRIVLETRHFIVEQINEGVFAAIHRAGGWAIGNAGIVDMGDFTPVFDTMITVQAAAELREAAEQLTNKQVELVVNSHYHNDHIWGNQVFDRETRIISSVETRQLIMTEGQEEYDWYKENSGPRLNQLQAQYNMAGGMKSGRICSSG